MVRAETRRQGAPELKKMSFRYEAEGEGGRAVKGTVSAVSEITAQNMLAERGYTSVVLEPIANPLSLEGAIPSLFKVKSVQIINFSRQLATLLESGVTLLPAMQLLSQQKTTSGPFRRILGHVTSDLTTGSSLSFAMSRHRAVFTEVYRRTIEVGERTGKLETVLRELADHIERQDALGKKLKAAMTYPVILLVVAVGVTLVLLTVVLPPLTKMFETIGADLPLPTKILMALSKFVNGNIIFIGIFAAILALAIPYSIKSAKGQRYREWLVMNMPVMGSPVVMGELARVSRTMALMLGAGLALQDTMDILPRTTTNSLFRDALLRVRQQLFLGEGLAYPMATVPFFPPLMLQMVRVGEDSNTLPVSMRVVADFYEGAAQERIAAMVSMITPLSTIVLASIVTFVALAVIMPMYNLTSSF